MSMSANRTYGDELADVFTSYKTTNDENGSE